MEQWVADNLKVLRDAVGHDVDLTADELRMLEWLAGWDTRTVRIMYDIMRKIAKQDGET